MDVDLRKSEIQKKYQVEGIKEGLNHFLSGLAEYEDVVYETNIPNGHIVPVDVYKRQVWRCLKKNTMRKCVSF